MSGIRFITEDPVGTGFDRAFARNEAIRRRDEQIQTDAALRSGLQDMVGQGGYQSPAAGMAAPAAAPAPLASDDDYAVRTTVAEAGNEPEEGQAAVAHVINNRMRSGKWGNTYQSVVTAPKQFTPWNEGSGNDPRTISPNDPRYQKALAIWQKVKAGQMPDPTGGALHFANPQASTASWVPQALQGGQWTRIGNHVFFRGLDVGSDSGPGGQAMPQQPAPQPQAGRSYDPLISRLAAVPGGGRAALPLLQGQRLMDTADDRNATTLAGQQFRAQVQQSMQAQRLSAQAERRGEQRQDANMRLVAQALLKGDIATAEHFNGGPLPDNVRNNVQDQKRLGVAMRLTGAYYRADPQRAQAFTKAYMDTGSVDQAFQIAGPPEGNQNFKLVWLQDGEREALYSVGRSGTATPVTVGGQQGTAFGTPPAAPGRDGEPAPAPPVGGQAAGALATREPRTARGGTSVMQLRINAMKEAGATPEQIQEMVLGRDIKPATVVGLYRSVSNSVATAMPPIPPMKQQAAINAKMDAALPNWRALMGQAPGGMPAPGPTPAAPATRTPPQSGLGAAGGTASGYRQGPTAAPAYQSPAAPMAAPPARAPAPSRPPPAAVDQGSPPQRPNNVPPGAQYSPSRRMWRDPQGNIYDETGNPVRRPN